MATVQVLFHDRCFDGMCSAATFTRFYRERIDPTAEFRYRGLAHKQGTSWTPGILDDSDVHACVDFRYTSDPRLGWWFDHHQSAFESPEDEAHFRANPSDTKHLDVTAKSCTNFLARTVQARFGFDPSPLAEMLHWAEIIDGALFPDAKTAVDLEAPALKLMLLAEATPDAATLLPRIIGELTTKSPTEVVALPFVAEALKPLLDAHFRTVALITERATLDGGVVSFDVADLGIDNFNKFIGYRKFPDARYSVGVSAGKSRAKVSVGSNPWPKTPRTHNLADLCKAYGGGGHAAVGACSFPPDRLDEARAAAAAIAAQLRVG